MTETAGSWRATLYMAMRSAVLINPKIDNFYTPHYT